MQRTPPAVELGDAPRTTSVREEVERVFEIAAAETRALLRRERESSGKDFALLYDAIEERLFSPTFSVAEARRRGDVGRDTPPLAESLPDDFDRHRIHTARRMLELAKDSIPTGQAAVAVGFTNYLTWCRTFLRVTGEKATRVSLPLQLRPGLDDLTWHLAWRGELPFDDAVVLLRRLAYLYPGALDGDPPPAVFLDRDDTVPATRRRALGLSHAEAEVARDQAARMPLARLRERIAGLPDEVAPVLAEVADNLFDPALAVARSLDGTARDGGITTKVHFYLGHTLGVVIERPRVRTAIGLIGDPRFTVDRIAEAVGLSRRRLDRSFEKLTGAAPSDVLQTCRETAHHPIRDLWRRAESGELAAAEVRLLGGILLGLHPRVFEHHRPARLAVRRDVDEACVEEVVAVAGGVAENVKAKHEKMLRTHPDYSAAQWYVRWLRRRLGAETLEDAWLEWLKANRDLDELLRLPRRRRAARVREDEALQRDAFLWLLVDCVGVRLFHDAEESEHFADLAVAAAEARWRRERKAAGAGEGMGKTAETTAASAGMRGLTRAFKGNAIQRRNALEESSEEFERGFAAIRSHGVGPWITGRMLSLHASLLDRLAKPREARRALFRAGALMKKARDPLERLRAAIQRAPTWFAAGIDPTRLLTRCIKRLRHYPFATDLIQTAHVNRLQSRLYLADRLTGRCLAEIRTLRAGLPPPTSAFSRTHHEQIDGLIAVLSGEPAAGAKIFRSLASWYEERNLLAYATVSWLQYSWATLEFDYDEARKAARVAYDHMVTSGFNSHEQQKIAERICREAERRSLTRDTLRRCILASVCPKSDARRAPGAHRV